MKPTPRPRKKPGPKQRAAALVLKKRAVQAGNERDKAGK